MDSSDVSLSIFLSIFFDSWYMYLSIFFDSRYFFRTVDLGWCPDDETILHKLLFWPLLVGTRRWIQNHTFRFSWTSKSKFSCECDCEVEIVKQHTAVGNSKESKNNQLANRNRFKTTIQILINQIDNQKQKIEKKRNRSKQKSNPNFSDQFWIQPKTSILEQ